MSTLKVNAIRGTGASLDAISVNATDGTCTANISNPRSFRNIVQNGSFQVAQRGTSSTADGYQTVDRWSSNPGSNNNVNTQAQVSLSSSDTGPWEKGFRKAYQITNGDQTATEAGDYIEIYHYIEDQNIANSGWDYTSSSSKLTLSFWVKSSVAQKFYGFLYSREAWTGNGKMYSFEISNGGSNLSANTWTKITHTIPGDSGLAFDSDNTNGLAIGIFPFEGTNYTTSGHSLNTWAAWDAGSKVPDMDATWWEANGATFALTGVQLEVGDVATDFEHRSYGEELARCQRYFFSIFGDDSDYAGIMGYANSSSDMRYSVRFPVPMRANPSYTGSTTGFALDTADDSTTINLNVLEIWRSIKTPNPASCSLKKSPGGMTAGQGGQLEFVEDGGWLFFSADL